MASYYGSEIIYNLIPSSTFGLRIVNFDSGTSESDGGSVASLVQKYIYRKPKPYFYGRTFNNALEFDVTLAAEQPIDATTRGIIESWLLGQQSYQPFQILQDDLSNVYMNCIFTKSQNKYIGNLNRSLTIHGVCDAPWGYTYPITWNRSYPDGVITNETFYIDNQSDDTDYLYPSLVFTTNSIGTSFSLTNVNDPNRQFLFDGISALENMTVDNYKQEISSDTGLMRISKFNKKFFRLLPGMNQLQIVGGITYFAMTYSFARKIGG